MEPRLLDLMRRYVFGFVNSHDPAVARDIMRPDYRLNMGDDRLEGRDDAYIPAVLHQISQFPALGFTIHELITDGTRTALLFTEHGRSARQPALGAAWRGVSIYRAEAGALAECWVEQDHFGRRAQLSTGVADQVGPVALDPWSGHAPVTAAERDAGLAAVDRWAAGLTAWPPPDATVDTGCAAGWQPSVEVSGVDVRVCVVEGRRVAFNAKVSGVYRGGLPDYEGDAGPVQLQVAAFASTVPEGLVDVDIVTNRVAVQRQLRNAAAAGRADA